MAISLRSALRDPSDIAGRALVSSVGKRRVAGIAFALCLRARPRILRIGPRRTGSLDVVDVTFAHRADFGASA